MSTQWIFGYGSLIWRPSFPYEERRKAWVTGWQRRFWQGSTDHRGVPEAPGRVVTLIEAPTARCWGMLYRIDPSQSKTILDELDYREKGGYDRLIVDACTETSGTAIEALTYVAHAGNPNYLGPAPDHEIAAQIAESTGPSGHNEEYLRRLHEEFVTHGIADDHVSRLYELLAS